MDPSGRVSNTAVTVKSAPNVSHPRQVTMVFPSLPALTSTVFMFDGAATFNALLDEPNSSARILNDTSAPDSPGSGTPSAALAPRATENATTAANANLHHL